MAEEKLNEKIVGDLKSYVNLRVDAVKLNLVEHLSSVIGRGIALVIALFFINLALMIFTAAIVYGVYMWLGSPIWSIVIVGTFYLLLGVAVLLLRKFFINKMIELFSAIFFKRQEEDVYEEP